jgi:hypothetical protein
MRWGRRMRCEEVQSVAAEIALGIANAEDRAEALRHLSTCAECRRVVEQLSQVADELLMLAPTQEPPPGFESRVVGELELKQAPRGRRSRWLSPRWLIPRLAPALVAAAITATALVAVYDDERQVAERYRETLAEADGEYFGAEPLRDETGARAGVAFAYQGSPSWMLLTVDAAHRDGVQRGELVTRKGRTIALGPLELDAEGSWGGALPVDYYAVASIRLLGDSPGEVVQASFSGGGD